MKKLLTTTVFLLIALANVSYGQGWRIQDERMVVLPYGDPSIAIVALAIIYPSSDCLPIATIIFTFGKGLGEFVSQTASSGKKEQMTWALDGEEFSSKTAFTRYSDGAETAMLASENMMAKLSSAEVISVWVGTKGFFPTPRDIIFPPMPLIKEGFISANVKAHLACTSI